ncbi:diacylglycerol kinase [Tissierella sp. Yu-01]|uniref:diacylglycerol kinase n=1 Tax=Tissierella sp. Yu-01 TaxID=3035694 RepID=UPI00240DE888|nr:diacylglycerol kinase [Tissierella sp. Yu-01]WFA09553.1 diacylglycerol kinase [Tissierella sp. Yu-01]
MKINRIIESFNHAVNGIIWAIKSEKNLKVHYIIAILILGLSLFYDFSRLEFLSLLFAVSLVLISEMLNTAIEKTIDLVTDEFHPLAKIAKDVSAGAVLIAAVNSIVVGYLLFFDRLNTFTNQIIYKIHNSEVHLTFIAILLVVLFTIGLKAKYFKGKGTHFQGGTVSGHAALSFCIATIISTLASHILITTLAYVLAILVAESRIEGKIHTFIEVFNGGLLGTLIGILIFQIIG